MATIDDLEREVRKLRQRVNDLQGVGREQELVAELVADADVENQPTKRGFARAVAQSNAAVCEDLERRAVAELKSWTAVSPLQLDSFRRNYGGLSGLGASRLDELISRYAPGR